MKYLPCHVILSAGQEDRDFSRLQRFKMAAKQLSGVLRTYIAAGKATPSPPLGPSLGQVENYFLLYLFYFFFRELTRSFALYSSAE